MFTDCRLSFLKGINRLLIIKCKLKILKVVAYTTFFFGLQSALWALIRTRPHFMKGQIKYKNTYFHLHLHPQFKKDNQYSFIKIQLCYWPTKWSIYAFTSFPCYAATETSKYSQFMMVCNYSMVKHMFFSIKYMNLSLNSPRNDIHKPFSNISGWIRTIQQVCRTNFSVSSQAFVANSKM